LNNALKVDANKRDIKNHFDNNSTNTLSNKYSGQMDRNDDTRIQGMGSVNFDTKKYNKLVQAWKQAGEPKGELVDIKGGFGVPFKGYEDLYNWADGGILGQFAKDALDIKPQTQSQFNTTNLRIPSEFESQKTAIQGIYNLYDNGRINDQAAINRLKSLGMSEEQAIELLITETKKSLKKRI
jgi:hypothetical protein